MRTSVTYRLLAAFLMATAAFAQPGEALTHGIAHRREHQHQREHRHEREHQSERSHDLREADSGASEWSAPDHAHSHAHADVDDASIRSKVGMQSPAHPVALPESATRAAAAAVPSLRAPLARGDPATGPPPRLRAPPVR